MLSIRCAARAIGIGPYVAIDATPGLRDVRSTRMAGTPRAAYDYPYGITVNALGCASSDEGEAAAFLTYAKTGRAVLAQPGATAQINDQKGIRCFRYPHHPATSSRPIRSRSWLLERGLSQGAGATRLRSSTARCLISRVRSAAARRQSRQGPGVPKIELGNRIDEPPYRAYPVTCGITFTFGGVRSIATRR